MFFKVDIKIHRRCCLQQVAIWNSWVMLYVRQNTQVALSVRPWIVSLSIMRCENNKIWREKFPGIDDDLLRRFESWEMRDESHFLYMSSFFFAAWSTLLALQFCFTTDCDDLTVNRHSRRLYQNLNETLFGCFQRILSQVPNSRCTARPPAVGISLKNFYLAQFCHANTSKSIVSPTLCLLQLINFRLKRCSKHNRNFCCCKKRLRNSSKKYWIWFNQGVG